MFFVTCFVYYVPWCLYDGIVTAANVRTDLREDKQNASCKTGFFYPLVTKYRHNSTWLKQSLRNTKYLPS